MSDKQTHPLTDVLSAALSKEWGKLPDDTKENVRAAVADIITHLNLSDSALEEKPFPEARRVDWFKVYNEESGVEVTCTFRANTDAEVERRIDEFLARRGIKTGGVWTSIDTKIEKRAEAKSERIGNYHDGHNKEAQQERQAAPPATAQAGQAQSGALYCQALELAAMPAKEDDPTNFMWKVKTNKSKYFVPMYEEAITAAAGMLRENGIEVSQLFVNNKPATYQLPGWTADYQTNDKGYPKKILALYPPA